MQGRRKAAPKVCVSRTSDHECLLPKVFLKLLLSIMVMPRQKHSFKSRASTCYSTPLAKGTKSTAIHFLIFEHFTANHLNWLLSQMLCVSRHRGHVVNLFAQKGHVSKVRMCTPRDRRVFASAWISKGVFRHQLQCQTHRLKAHWLKPTNILTSCSSKCRLTRFGFLGQCSISYASRDAMPDCCFKSGLKLFGF